MPGAFFGPKHRKHHKHKIQDDRQGTKDPAPSEGGPYMRTESPTRRSWLACEVATRVLVEKR